MMGCGTAGSHGELSAAEKRSAIGQNKCQDKLMEMIGHRGASFDAPENTLAAIRLAWEQGADAVEVDVHMSRDGQIVVIHDDNTRRTAGLRKRVADQTAAELQELDAGSWKSSRWAGERIPLLWEALEIIPRGKRFFIEIKCGEGFIPAFEALRNKWQELAGRLVLIGFSFDLMQQVKKAFPELEVCWIVEFRRSLKTGRWSPDKRGVLEKVLQGNLDGLDTSAKGPLTAEWIGQVKEARLSYYVWTVDKPVVAQKLLKAGVDGITTNRPAWLREALR
jgi:glycerophosphoryl diester phosphodiesterase